MCAVKRGIKVQLFNPSMKNPVILPGRVVQLLLGHKKLESTVRYLGIEVDDALEISESIEI